MAGHFTFDPHPTETSIRMELARQQATLGQQQARLANRLLESNQLMAAYDEERQAMRAVLAAILAQMQAWMDEEEEKRELERREREKLTTLLKRSA
jgi:hypothetical protein